MRSLMFANIDVKNNNNAILFGRLQKISVHDQSA